MLTKARLVELLETEREAHRLERAEWSKERGDLLQRIQAPEIAVQEHVALPDREPLFALPFDDDDAYNAAVAERNGGS